MNRLSALALVATLAGTAGAQTGAASARVSGKVYVPMMPAQPAAAQRDFALANLTNLMPPELLSAIQQADPKTQAGQDLLRPFEVLLEESVGPGAAPERVLALAKSRQSGETLAAIDGRSESAGRAGEEDAGVADAIESAGRGLAALARLEPVMLAWNPEHAGRFQRAKAKGESRLAALRIAAEGARKLAPRGADGVASAADAPAPLAKAARASRAFSAARLAPFVRPARSGSERGPSDLPTAASGKLVETRDLLGMHPADAVGQGWEDSAQAMVWRGVSLIRTQRLPPGIWDGSRLKPDGTLSGLSWRARMLGKALASEAEEREVGFRARALAHVRYLHLNGHERWLEAARAANVPVGPRRVDLSGPGWREQGGLFARYLRRHAAELEIPGFAALAGAALGTLGLLGLGPAMLASGMGLAAFGLAAMWTIEEFNVNGYTPKQRRLTVGALGLLLAALLW